MNQMLRSIFNVVVAQTSIKNMIKRHKEKKSFMVEHFYY